MAFSFSSPSPQFPNPQAQQHQLFSQSTPFSSFPQQQQQQQQQQQTPSPQIQFQLQPQQQQPQQQQQQLYLYTVDKSPAGYNTKWAELHPDSQKLLLQIEERILEYKDESQRLDQCSRLNDSSVSSDSFELDASHIMQELGVISTSMEREKVSVQELMNEANNMLWNTEVAVRSYMMLRPRFLHPNISATSNFLPASQTMGDINSSSINQPACSSIVAVYDFYSGIPKRPSPFLQHTVARFEKYLTECCQWIEELEQLVLMDTDKSSSRSGSLQSLPNIMTNVHDFFVHVAAKVESLHQYIESMKTAYLADQRRHGDGNDPFLEADRRENAKQEAAARRVHPTLHLPAVTQPLTQGTGLFASSGMHASSVPQQSVGSTGASSSSGFSIFSTPSSAAAAASGSLFTTPSASAPASTMFGLPGFSPQSTVFGTASTSLGSAQTPLLIGASTPSVASTPAIGSSTLFSTPSFVSGAAMGSGSSFGAASNKSRAKPRSTRR